ncbi:bacteriorhodopsin [uncultured Sphingomonas sp.]|uniref:bacteriorhodopsin n=1 Tax=uncultured Sphingomonas sp. TaxID=158754 RepID=UPI0025D3E75A|nr:bacteriorhodopsin [uncultured Sphingomonas sp.]
MTTSDWLWFGFAAMAAGSVILLAMGWNRRTRDEENHYLLHLFVTLTAMASYLAMALGQGSILLADGREFYVARYLDWSITTPMLLTGLCLTALHAPFRRWALLLGLVFTDFYMIATGVVAGFSPTGSTAKWAWYLISSGAFLFIYIGLWGPVRTESEKSGPRAAKLFKTNATILSVVWFAYPVIFLLGSEGTKAIDPTATAALYTIFDVVAKVVYGIFSMAATRAKVSADLAADEVPEHDLRPAPVAYHTVEAPGRTERVEPSHRVQPNHR